MKKSFIGVVVLTFLIGLTAGASLRSGPAEVSASSSGQRVCVNQRTGAMRLASVKRCARTERAVVFGMPGAPGPAGPPGPKGETGVTGSSASVKTRSVTLWYSSGTTFGGCGDGSLSGAMSGVLFDGVTFDNASLTSRFSWKPIFNCTITLKVVDE